MAVTLITNGGIEHKSYEDFKAYAKEDPNRVFRMNSRQVDPAEVRDGDRVNVVIKASGN